MKKLVTLLVLLTFQFGFSQEKVSKSASESTIKDSSYYTTGNVELMPEYPGGIEKFYEYIQNKFKFPADKNFDGGKVIVSFFVETDGSLADIEVLKDVGFGTGQEAMRILKKCKRWKPAEQNGVPVRCFYILPITLPSN